MSLLVAFAQSGAFDSMSGLSGCFCIESGIQPVPASEQLELDLPMSIYSVNFSLKLRE